MKDVHKKRTINDGMYVYNRVKRMRCFSVVDELLVYNMTTTIGVINTNNKLRINFVIVAISLTLVPV